MKQSARQSLVQAGSGILGLSFSLAAHAAGLTPNTPASGAAWAADAATGPVLPAAALVLAWAPLLLLALLGTVLAVLILRQPAERSPASRRQRAEAAAGLEGTVLISAVKR